MLYHLSVFHIEACGLVLPFILRSSMLMTFLVFSDAKSANLRFFFFLLGWDVVFQLDYRYFDTHLLSNQNSSTCEKFIHLKNRFFY